MAAAGVKHFPFLYLPLRVGRLAHSGVRARFWEFFRRNWVCGRFYAVLGLNILEASPKDLAMGNYFNAISGFILIVTIPLFKSKGKRDAGPSQRGSHLTCWHIPIRSGIFLYTTWNIAFVYAENPGYAASSLCILLAAEIYPLIKRRPELYVQARAYTLAVHILIRATYDIFTPMRIYRPSQAIRRSITGVLSTLLCTCLTSSTTS